VTPPAYHQDVVNQSPDEYFVEQQRLHARYAAALDRDQEGRLAAEWLHTQDEAARRACAEEARLAAEREATLAAELLHTREEFMALVLRASRRPR
jgi:hypothetical protein